MSKTLANLSARTRTFLDEATTGDWTDAEVTREINVFYMKAYSAVVGVFEDYYSEKTSFNSVANQQEYGTSDGFPTDFYKARRVEINLNPSNSNAVAKRALPISLDEVLRDLGNANVSVTAYRNPSYYLRGNKLGFIPVPTEAGTNAISLWYIKIITELSATTDTIDIPFPDRYGPVIAKGAAGELLRKGQQEETVALRYLAEFDKEVEEMRQELEDRIADANKQIIDTVGEDVDFQGGGFY